MHLYLPYFYVYGVGGVIFCVGLFFAWLQGYFSGSARGLRNLVITLLVAIFFMAIQGYLQFAPMRTAPPQPYEGGAEHVLKQQGGTRGTPIDYVIMIGYFLAILAVGTWFSRGQKTTKDFFFAGQRFSWWLIAASLIATTVGSYSFVKYSDKGFQYGLSSSQTYLNDWVWFPLLVFGWLPILYLSRVSSIPEYFGRRFDSTIRMWATIFVLIYLIGYVGVNLFTMGRVLNALVGWQVPVAAAIVAIISCVYVTAGGQTSVVMTDLLQGVMLLLTGALILLLGVQSVGGFGQFWTHLPREARLAFPNFNEDPGFPSVGIFWQDAVANSAMFYFLNQGIIMRFLAARSLQESRKAALSMVLVLMTVGACVVGCGGWVARVLVHSGRLPDDIGSHQAFYIATELLSRPGMFGLILAALTAALMSTVDTLITAVSAVVVNDFYKPYVQPAAGERELLRVARICSVSVTVLGVVLVPIFNQFRSIYEAHGAFTAAVTPPLVVTLLLSVFWKRFTRTAALWTLVGGLIAIGASLFFPELIYPFAHGVPMPQVEDTFLSGMKQYKYMRACYGICVCTTIGVIVSWFTKPDSAQKQSKLVVGSHDEVVQPTTLRQAEARVERSAEIPQEMENGLACVRVSALLAEQLACTVGERIYVTDRRWWLGGLRSAHVIVTEVIDEKDESILWIDSRTWSKLVARGRNDKPLRIEKF